MSIYYYSCYNTYIPHDPLTKSSSIYAYTDDEATASAEAATTLPQSSPPSVATDGVGVTGPLRLSQC